MAFSEGDRVTCGLSDFLALQDEMKTSRSKSGLSNIKDAFAKNFKAINISSAPKYVHIQGVLQV